MKLLKREDSNIKANEIKRQQILEGVKLAKKVDALRNELLALQKDRAEFIEGTVREMKKAIEPLEIYKKTLEENLVTLEEQRQQIIREIKKYGI